MSTYSARVKAPRRIGSSKVFNWSVQEVMYDMIKAKSEGKAGAQALAHATKDIKEQFPDTLDQAKLPAPVLMAISRIGKDGKPVKSAFSPKASVHSIVGAKPVTKVKAAIRKVVPIAKWKAPLADPFTEALIKAAQGGNKP